jgi:hypothetical protein
MCDTAEGRLLSSDNPPIGARLLDVDTRGVAELLEALAASRATGLSTVFPYQDPLRPSPAKKDGGRLSKFPKVVLGDLFVLDTSAAPEADKSSLSGFLR